jgi:hypothetical protein
MIDVNDRQQLASYAVLWCTSGRGCHHGIVATPRHGVMWCYCAGRGSTVGTVVSAVIFIIAS